MEFNHEAKTVTEACGYTNELDIAFIGKLREATSDGKETSFSKRIETVLGMIKTEKDLVMLIHVTVSNARRLQQVLDIRSTLFGISEGEDAPECPCENCVAERAGKTEVKDETPATEEV